MTTRLSTKGQLIIPKEIRERHQWRAGSELIVEDRGDCVVLRGLDPMPETRLEDLAGCTGYRGPRRSLDELEEAVGRGAKASR